MISLFILLAVFASSLANTDECIGPHRTICRNGFLAARCNRLTECSRIWASSKWISYSEDSSNFCRLCKSGITLTPNSFDIRLFCIHTKTESCLHVFSTIVNATSQQNSHEITCNLFGACDSMLYGYDLNFGSTTCESCKTAVEEIKEKFSLNTPDEVVVILNTVVCSHLPTNLIPFCQKVVKSHIPYILKLVAEEMDTEIICKHLGLCSHNLPTEAIEDLLQNSRNTKVQKPNSIERVYSWTNRPTVKHHKFTSYDLKFSFLENQTCLECIDFLNKLKSTLEQENNRDYLKVYLIYQVCPLFDGISFLCQLMIKENFAVVIEGIEKIQPERFCFAFGMCSTALSTSSNQFPVVCKICELAISELVKMTFDNTTEEAIRKALDEVCDLLPGSYGPKCIVLVDKFGAQIIQALVSGTAPKLICSTIGLCPGIEKPVAKPETFVSLPRPSGRDFCATCEILIEFLYDQLEKNSTEEEIRHFLDKICEYVPKSERAMCDAYIEKFVNLLVNLIKERFPPHDICQKIQLCPAIQISTSDTSRCSEGPSFWCSSLTTSRLCGATFYCANVVWNPLRTPLLPSVLLGKNSSSTEMDKEWSTLKAMVGKPRYRNCSYQRLEEICISMENAISCGYLARCYTFLMKSYADKLDKRPDHHEVALDMVDETSAEGSATCSICMDIVVYWSKMAGLPYFESQAFYDCLRYDSSEKVQKCYKLVENESGLMEALKNNKDHNDALSICQLKSYCRSQVHQDHSVAKKRPLAITSPFHYNPLNTDTTVSKCPADTTDWCNSAVIARQCNVFEMCQKYVWHTTSTSPEYMTTPTPQPESLRVSQHSLSENWHLPQGSRCIEGISYFCSSLKAAKECKSIEFCQTNVWKNKTPSTESVAEPVEKNNVKAMNKCIWGPSYWCSSKRNAQLCGPAAELHCNRFVWNSDSQPESLSSPWASVSASASATAQYQEVDTKENINQFPKSFIQSLSSPPASASASATAAYQEADTKENINQFPKSFIQTRRIVSFGKRLVGSKKCTWGPAYWCSSVSAAKSCGDSTYKHCVETVWLKTPVE